MILTTNIASATETSTLTPKRVSFPKTVTGPATNDTPSEAVYKLTDYTYKYNKSEVTNPTSSAQIEFDNDKENIKWVLWVDGGLMDGKKDYVIIENKILTSDATEDFTEETNKTKFIENLKDYAYIQATSEVVIESGNKINRLTIKFSKWLDRKRVYVEAYRNGPDHNNSKDYVKTTEVLASPEIIDAYWLDSQGKRITSVGFESNIKFYIETLGLINKTIRLRLFDYDGPFNPADSIPWNGNLSEHQCVITDRKFTQDYFVEAQNSSAYANAQSWVDGDLDVYINIALQDTTIPISLEDRYANIGFLENKRAELFFAKKEEVVVNGISYTQYNKINTVFPGMKAYLVAQTANLSGAVTFSITEEIPLILSNTTDKLPLLIGENNETDFTATINEGYAVVEVKFQELDSTAYNQWNNILDNESEEGLTSKLIIKAQIDSDEYISTDEYNLKSSVIRYILKTDSIIKHHREVSNKARYIFKEDSGTLHYLALLDFSNIDQHDKNYIYKKVKAQLVDVRTIAAYSSGNVKFKFDKMNTSSRFYMDIDCLASFLAAMIEVSIEDLRFNGFSTSTGTSGVSSSHWDGMVGDLGYLHINNNSSVSVHLFSVSDTNRVKNSIFDYDRQVLFCNALYRYGFSKYKKDSTIPKARRRMLTEKFKLTSTSTEFTKLPHAEHYQTTNVRHYHHLHLSGLDISFFEIKTN